MAPRSVSSYLVSPGRCFPKPCRYIRLADTAESGTMESKDAVLWLTRAAFNGPEEDAKETAAESRILIFDKLGDGLPVGYEDIRILMEDVGFTIRFFENELQGRSYAGCISTHIGICWLFVHPSFSVMTLDPDGTNTLLSIILVDPVASFMHQDLIVRRCVQLITYWKHPLLPITTLIDAAITELGVETKTQLEALQARYGTLANPKTYSNMIKPSANISRFAHLASSLADLTHKRDIAIGLKALAEILLSSIDKFQDVYWKTIKPGGYHCQYLDNLIDYELASAANIVKDVGILHSIRGMSKLARGLDMVIHSGDRRSPRWIRKYSRKSLVSQSPDTKQGTVPISKAGEDLATISSDLKDVLMLLEILIGATAFLLCAIGIAIIFGKPEHRDWEPVEIVKVFIILPSLSFAVILGVFLGMKFFVRYHEEIEEGASALKSILKSSGSIISEEQTTSRMTDPDADAYEDLECEKRVRFSPHSVVIH